MMPPTKQARSDDYIDGLQVAYTLVYNLHEKARLPETKMAYMVAMKGLQEYIDAASADHQHRIILP